MLLKFLYINKDIRFIVFVSPWFGVVGVMNLYLIGIFWGIVVSCLPFSFCIALNDSDPCERLQGYVQKFDEFNNDNSDSAKFYLSAAIDLSLTCEDLNQHVELLAKKSILLRKEGLLDSANLLIKKAVQKARQRNDSSNLGKIYRIIGKDFYANSALDSSLYYFKIAESYFRLSKDSVDMLDMLHYRGMTYHKMSLYEKALADYMFGMEIARSLFDTVRMGSLYNNTAAILRMQKDLETARSYYKEAFQIFSIRKDKFRMSATLSNMAILEIDNDGDLQLADSLLSFSLKLARDINNNQAIASTLNNLGALNINEGNSHMAKSYFKESLQLSIEQGNLYLITKNKISLSNIHLELGHLEKALELAESSLQISLDGNLLEDVTQSYLILSEIYKAKNDPEEALLYYTKYHEFQDSLYNANKSRIINRLKIKHELSRKNAEIELLKNKQALQEAKLEASQGEQRLMTVVLFFLISTIVLIVIFFVKSKRFNVFLKKQQAEILKKKH